MSNMSTQDANAASHRNLLVVITSAGIIVLLALISAFVWPGWAFNHEVVPAKSHISSPKTPSIPAKALPANATVLLKSMPDSVLDFARVSAVPSANWSDATPLEEYTLKYDTGEADGEVTLTVAQWSTRDSANKQYESAYDSLKGDDIVSGKIMIADKAVGNYVVRSDEGDKRRAKALWQNDTAVFEVSGSRQSVERFYRTFPM
ncbi:hypothetical protein [Gardnerella sp. 2492-Sm]|uniref:hypothetical protein n=1 Tax=unclassified Gardnerella TaxID=2628112 RepID=UPI003CFDBFA7